MLKKAHSGDGDWSTSAAFLGLLTFILGLRFNLAVLMRERYSPLAHCPSFVSLCRASDYACSRMLRLGGRNSPERGGGKALYR